MMLSLRLLVPALCTQLNPKHTPALLDVLATTGLHGRWLQGRTVGVARG